MYLYHQDWYTYHDTIDRLRSHVIIYDSIKVQYTCIFESKCGIYLMYSNSFTVNLKGKHIRFLLDK